MTVIDLRGLADSLGAPVPIDRGTMTAQYWAGDRPAVRVDGSDVIFPAAITLPIVNETSVSVDLPPTLALCCVRWVFHFAPFRFERFTSIPDVPGPVPFGDLPVVDPETFLPFDPEGTLAGTIQTEIVPYVTAAVAARDAAVAAKDAAEAVPATTDGLMTAVASDPDSAFAIQQKNTIDGRVGAVARGNDGSEYRIVACALRPDAAGVWGVIQDGNHVPSYIESVTQNAAGVVVQFVSGVKTVAVLVTPDETMAMSGLTAGASVAPDAATIRMSWSVTGDRVYWNGTAWTSTNNSFSAFAFNATTGVLTCTRRGTFVANTAVVAASRKPGTHVFVDGVNPSQIRIGFADMAGNPITTPSAECDAYLVGPMRASSTIDPSTITSAEYALANLWLLGIVQTSP